MDTSKEYIKMCEKATEIQEIWQPKEWDYIWSNVERDKGWEVWVLSGYETDSGYYGPGIDDDWGTKEERECGRITTWLPRQDQLQDMWLNRETVDAWGTPVEIDQKTDRVFWLFQKFTDSIQERKYSAQTGEQLWLRYVMKEKYNKTWNGDDWE